MSPTDILLHLQMCYSAIIREASSSNRWKQTETHSQPVCRESLHRMSSSNPSPWGSGHIERGGRKKEPEGMTNIRRTRSSASTKKDSHELTVGRHGSAPGPLCIYSFQFSICMGLLTVFSFVCLILLYFNFFHVKNKCCLT